MRRWHRSWKVWGIVGMLPALLLLGACTRFGATITRPEDPVVLEGSSLPKLLGADPAHVVAFAWDGRTWHQIPVQVDERDLVNPGQILHRPTSNYATLTDGSPFDILVYTPPPSTEPGYTSWATYTPPDSDPTLDANDEVSFLANDTGRPVDSGTPAPAGVDAASREQVEVTDPLQNDAWGYVYLFTSPTLTGADGGNTGVSYTFSLDAGSYTATYKMGTGALAPNNVAGTNPEHSTVVTPAYRQTYGDRWLNDGLQITSGTASGAPILERGRYQLIPGYCGRSEDTFDDAVRSSPYEAAFIVNISGPVRAIRSHIGANSGQYTMDTDIFYPRREDSITALRVHSIPGVMAFDDLATGTQGLHYADDQNSGVPIDGVPDTIVADHPALWQMVSGPQGSLVTTHTIDTDIAGLQLSTYYLDQQPASPTPCTGDATAWGQNGIRVTGPGGGSLPCTDPTICAGANRFVTTRFRFFEPPGVSTSAAAAFFSRAVEPPTTTVTG